MDHIDLPLLINVWGPLALYIDENEAPPRRLSRICSHSCLRDKYASSNVTLAQDGIADNRLTAYVAYAIAVRGRPSFARHRWSPIIGIACEDGDAGWEMARAKLIHAAHKRQRMLLSRQTCALQSNERLKSRVKN
jgi:hypothetical protein